MDDALQLRFRQSFWRAFREADSIRLRQWERSSVTLPQLRVLYHLRRHPGATTGELARRLGITVSTTSGLVIKLVDRGLITRGSLADDRRQAPLRLSEDGAALLGELSDEGRHYLGDVAERLGSDLEQVTQVLELLAEAAVLDHTSDETTGRCCVPRPRNHNQHISMTPQHPQPEPTTGQHDAPARAGTEAAGEVHHHA